VDVDELQKRIRRFRNEYLNTAMGREHVRHQTEEPTEVQAVFESLQGDRQAGRDITDGTLRRLLPHSDTKGNRERGVRISTWHCITKDVKSWFEGAGWKMPAEWPDVANWLLDIAEAGREEDWGRWRDLAHAPAQKGFACGFITPIVHGLNPRLPVINSKFVKTYAVVAQHLGLADEISPALDAYPESQARLVALVGKLDPLGLHGIDEWDMFCHWSVSKRLGGKTDGPVAPVAGPAPAAISAEARPTSGPHQDICEVLQQAQHDTQNHDRFESAVGFAFVELGFETEHIGGSGETDIVARADLGDEGFSAVVDAKTSQKGAPRGNINYEPIKGHQEQHEADYAIVVAPGFSQGNTVQHAVNRSVGLLTTDRLIELVRLSRRQALSLFVLKSILSQVGFVLVQRKWDKRGCSLS
jgi:hypothetical protein